MKFTIDRDVFAAALTRCAPFCEPRSPIPILACVKLTADKAGLEICATDMDAAITEGIAASSVSVSEEGSVCVSGERLKNLIASLRPGADVRISAEKAGLRIESGSVKVVFETHDPSDYPGMLAEGLVLAFTVNAKELDRVLAMAIPTISDEQARHYLNGIFMSITDGSIAAVSTDGHRLTVCRLAHEGETAEFPSLIVPKLTCSRLRSLLKGGDQQVEFSTGGTPATRLCIRSGRWSLTSKLVDGTYPEYQRVAAQLIETPAVVDADALATALARVEIATETETKINTKYRGVACRLSSGSIRLQYGSENGPGLNDELAAEYSGPEMVVGFNARYVRDALQVLDSDQAELHVTDPGSPFRVCRKSDPLEHITVMPWRL